MAPRHNFYGLSGRGHNKTDRKAFCRELESMFAFSVDEKRDRYQHVARIQSILKGGSSGTTLKSWINALTAIHDIMGMLQPYSALVAGEHLCKVLLKPYGYGVPEESSDDEE